MQFNITSRDKAAILLGIILEAVDKIANPPRRTFGILAGIRSAAFKAVVSTSSISKSEKDYEKFLMLGIKRE